MSDVFYTFQHRHPSTVKDKVLGPLTTLGIGGPADLYYELEILEELPALIHTADELKLPFFVFGGGSNLVFADEGFRGLVVRMKAKTIRVDGNRIVADAGALLSQVLQTAMKNGLTGMENFMGLPGTVGGAVRGNAGAFGSEMKDVLEKIFIWNREKGIHEEPASYCDFSYRSSKIKKHQGRDIVLRAVFALSPGDTKTSMKNSAGVIAGRLAKQPTGKTTGSFFKNPGPNHPAGRLLDEAGCKGLRVGNIQVSEQHANWIMNLGGATQQDVMALAKKMQQEVRLLHDIILEPEVQFVGETGPISL